MAELKRRNMGYPGAGRKFTAMGFPETERNIANKIARGGLQRCFSPMSCRDWLHHIALRGCLIAALSVAVSSEGKTQADPSNPAQQTQAQQPAPEQAGSPPPSQQPQPVPVEQQQREPEYYKPRCDKPKDREESDLCQQIRMAKAAEDAVWWARAQSILGIFGFAAVLFSLFFTGWAAVAAGRAARAAMEANKISHRNSVAERRAWLELVRVNTLKQELNIADDAVGMVPITTVRNQGQSPAIKVAFHFRLRPFAGGEGAEELLRQFRATAHGVGDEVIFRGGEATQHAGIFAPRNLIEEAAAKRNRHDTAPLAGLLFVNVTYNVIGDDERHETGAVYRLHQFDMATDMRGKCAVSLKPAGYQFPGWAT